jgi:chromosome segregation ATPase
MDTEFTNTLRRIIREEVQPIVHKEVDSSLKPINEHLGSLDTSAANLKSSTSSLEVSFSGLDSRLKKLETRFDGLEIQVVNARAEMNHGFRSIESKLAKQDEKLDAMLEAWSIQKQHRRQLDNHELRLSAVESRIPSLT